MEWLEVARLLIVVKYVADSVHACRSFQAARPEVVFDVLEDAAILVLCV